MSSREVRLQFDPVTLFLQDLEVRMLIGIHDFEQKERQRVLVSVELELDVDPHAVGNDMAATVDYDYIRDGVHAYVQTSRVWLQEALCRHVLELALSRQGVARATVTTRKPDVYPDAAAVGCRMSGSRTGP